MRKILSVFIITICLLPTIPLARQSPNDDRHTLALPQIVDPGFETFTLAPGPYYGWYCDDLVDPSDSRSARVTMTADATDKVEGSYSLRIEQAELRPPGAGFASLDQVVEMPEQDLTTRRFTLSVAMRGELTEPLTIVIYVWGSDNTAQEIARREVTVSSSWSRAKLKFKVPRQQNLFGIWFYLPREPGVRLWLDDVRLAPRGN